MRRALQLTALLLAAVCALIPLSPAFVERWFSVGAYPWIQRSLTPLSNLLPIALFDLVTVAAGVWATVTLIRYVRRARRTRSWRPIGVAGARLATAVALGYLAFLCLWGFNYRRVPMAQRLVLDKPAPSVADVRSLGLSAAERLNELHAPAHAARWDTTPWANREMTSAFAAVQRLLTGAPPAAPGRLKRSFYGWYFRWAGVDGMVNPFGLEVLGNPDLLPWEVPFVAAHEWAHLAGYADEAEANFVGWLTCLGAGAQARYSAWLFLYWQINSESVPAERARLTAALAPGPTRDIEAIVDRMRRGQLPPLRRASWRVYDRYLKANRVDAGVRSYGAVITLILRARFEDGWRPVRRAPAAASP